MSAERKNRFGSETLIFWGAGATASVGMPVTGTQKDFINVLIGKREPRQTLRERIRDAVNPNSRWIEPLHDLLLVLGDDIEEENKNTPEGAFRNIGMITPDAREAMRNNWSEPSEMALDARIHHLRSLFDWPALKEAGRICPGFEEEKGFVLQDLFNVIDIHIASGQGFCAYDGPIAHGRLVAARRALQMLLNTLFFIKWHDALDGEWQGAELKKHLGFARLLTKYHQETGIQRADSMRDYDSRDFYLGEVAFASLNYDPICLWSQFIANKNANDDYPPHIGCPAVPLKIFHDMGIFMATRRLSRKEGDECKEAVWYPMNEAVVQRLNDREYAGRRVMINKLLFPHGCVCWRECPSCGKMCGYIGNEWTFESRTLLPPPPLRGFTEIKGLPLSEGRDIPQEERKLHALGAVDARACVHCGTMTFAEHTQATMQSNFKSAPPSFLEEIKRDLRVATQAADHIVLMGYSLPSDDVEYRAFFAARRNHSGGTPPRCSVIVGTKYGDRWHSPEEIENLLNANQGYGDAPFSTLKAARAIFGNENVRFYGGGIPQVFCDGDTPSVERVRKLLAWE